MSGEKTPTGFLQTEFNETRALFSPGGRWVAYDSDECGTPEIYVRPFPRSGGIWQVSTQRGVRMAWRSDGRSMSAKEEPGRGLTADAFASLLTRLGPDAERAGEAYEHLRRALVGFFTWRGAGTPEECADETLDRLAARLSQGLAVEDVPRFAHGIARMVLLEHWRRPEARGTTLEGTEPADRATPDDPEDDALHGCLDRCLGELAPDGRDLILTYYGAEGRARIQARRRLAQSLHLSESALRNRAQRLRDRLEPCIRRCLGASPAGPAALPDDTNR